MSEENNFSSFFEATFARSGFSNMGPCGRVIFGLVRLEEYAANLACSLFQSEANGLDFSDVLKTEIIDTVFECCIFISEQTFVLENAELSNAVNILLGSISTLKNFECSKKEEIKLIFILFPLCIRSLICNISQRSNFSVSKKLPVSMIFFDQLSSRSQELEGVDFSGNFSGSNKELLIFFNALEKLSQK